MMSPFIEGDASLHGGRSLEQRRDRRYRIRIPVIMVCGKRTQTLFTDDVSFGGVFLRTDQPPVLRQLVKLTFGLFPNELDLKVHGIPVHVVRRGHPRRAAGVGIQLYALDHAQQARWDEFLEGVRKASQEGDR